MRVVIFFGILVFFAWSFSMTSCQSSGPKTFCDTTCNNDTLRFTIDHPDKPFVTIGMKDCMPDTITWSHDKLASNRKLLFSDLAGKEVHINKNFIRYYIKDTSYVWITFNECLNGQGFLIKIPFNKSGDILRKNSALNAIDPKFYVADNLAAYTDRGNIIVEDMTNGKKATMTFGQKIENMEYNDIHKTVDSVNITPTHVWAKVNIDNEWVVKEGDITLK